ncbi:unnamed protein product [Brachionus calyciflorus]|uniref:C2H2-type domain-containing protein n=1 Tax=Brachionus calyciflorus TaxID=104777 RepID=A0A814IVC7_9BILA|nr:unnamed protein product [Brachionus calyciflorus]
MPKNVFKLPVNLEIERLKRIYKPTLDSYVDVSDGLKNNFYQFVLPSLANPKVVKEISELPRYFCLFDRCKAAQKTFASKQKYVQHLQIQHDQDLPKGGSFISPNDKSTQPGGFWCSNCGHHYCRRDHLNNHIKTNVHCKNASVMHENPLVLKEIEVEQRLAIEYYPLGNDSVESKDKHVLSAANVVEEALTKKDVGQKQNFFSDKIVSFVQKLSCSMSMLTISKNQKQNLTARSKTIHGFCTSSNEIVQDKNEKASIDLKEEKSSKNLKRIVKRNESTDDETCIPSKISKANYDDSEDEILIDALNKWEESKKF